MTRGRNIGPRLRRLHDYEAIVGEQQFNAISIKIPPHFALNRLTLSSILSLFYLECSFLKCKDKLGCQHHK